MINRNNLEDLRAEMKTLKFDDKLIEQMEKEMAKGQPAFQLHTQVPADKGQLDVTLNFRQSGSSDNYYLNRYDLTLNKAQPLEEGKKYFVITPNPEKKGENLSRKFDSPALAIDYFKSQKHSSELAVGKSPADKMTLATMQKGSVDYVNKDFRGVYYTPPTTNSVYVNRGKGFTVEQSANMLQRRSVFREDFVNGGGESYAAWKGYKFDEPRDKYGNLGLSMYNSNYGFDLKKELESYQIKELTDAGKTENLMASIKNGNSPVVTVTNNKGEEGKLRIVAMPKYNNLNFYDLSGKPVMREQLKKEQGPEKAQGNIFDRKLQQDNQRQQGQAMGM